MNISTCSEETLSSSDSDGSEGNKTIYVDDVNKGKYHKDNGTYYTRAIIKEGVEVLKAGEDRSFDGGDIGVFRVNTKDKSMLKTVKFPRTLTELGDRCFMYCDQLVEVELPQSTNMLGKYCFQNCSALKSATFHGNIAVVPDRCFYKCTKLETVVFDAARIETIEQCAFQGCDILERLEANLNAVKEIGWQAFRGCKRLPAMKLFAGNLHNIKIGGAAFVNTKKVEEDDQGGKEVIDMTNNDDDDIDSDDGDSDGDGDDDSTVTYQRTGTGSPVSDSPFAFDNYEEEPTSIEPPIDVRTEEEEDSEDILAKLEMNQLEQAKLKLEMERVELEKQLRKKRKAEQREGKAEQKTNRRVTQSPEELKRVRELH